jgi:cytochrome c peroxidase
MENQVGKISFAQNAVIILFILAGVALAVHDFQGRDLAAKAPDIPEATATDLDRLIPPIPLTIDVDSRKVRLGERLYHDTRLSHDNTISCATCHDLKKGGTDQIKTPKGINGNMGPIRSPTTFNSGFFFSQFWDGRAKDLIEQAAGPVHNPKEMGSDWLEVIPKLSKDPYYMQAFSDIYSDAIKAGNITDAISEFEKSLITPNSRFDMFLRGNALALSADEKEDYRLFKEYGCISCHHG